MDISKLGILILKLYRFKDAATIDRIADEFLKVADIEDSSGTDPVAAAPVTTAPDPSGSLSPELSAFEPVVINGLRLLEGEAQALEILHRHGIGIKAEALHPPGCKLFPHRHHCRGMGGVLSHDGVQLRSSRPTASG